MDQSHPTFQEFKAYWQLSEEMITSATKEDVAEAALILAMQVAHFASKYGELQLLDLTQLLSAISVDEESVGLLRDGTQALVGVLGMVTGGELGEDEQPMQ